MGATRSSMGTSNSPANQLTLTRSDPAGIYYQNYVDQITNKLYTLLPGVTVKSFAYLKRIPSDDEDFLGGYGKGVVCTSLFRKAFY